MSEHQHHHSHPDSCEESIIINIENVFFCEQEEEHESRLVIEKLEYKNLIINKSIIMAVTISTSEFVTGSLGLVDHATSNPITGVTFSNISFSSSDATIFTAVPNTTDPSSVDVTGVAVGVANLLVTADVSYTDPNTSQPVTQTGKTATISVTVVASPVTSDLVVNFGSPQPKS